MAERSNVVLDDEMLLFQILPRLPATSLGRFRCVCKQWRSFLPTPMFTKMHLLHVNSQNHLKQLVVPTTKPCKYFQTIDCEAPEVGLSVNRSVPFKADYDEMSIIASLNGLVCLGIDSFEPPRVGRYSDIILWNPLTGDYKMLSKDNSHSRINNFEIHAMGYGLYYSCSQDDYKLLRVTLLDDAFVYSLKSDSWRKIDSRSPRLLNNWNLSCLLNENLYFFVEGMDRMDGMDVLTYSIIRFDTEVEKFTEIAAPSLECVAPHRFSLTVLSGCLHLCVSSVGITSPYKLELWKMDGDGEWTKMVSCCHTLFKGVPYKPLHLMKNGNWLMASRDNGDALEVDPEMKTGKKVCTSTPIDGPMDILWGGKFVETIVSLNRLIPTLLNVQLNQVELEVIGPAYSFGLWGVTEWYQSRSLYHRDGGANLIRYDGSSRGDVGNILGESHIAEDKEKRFWAGLTRTSGVQVGEFVTTRPT
ncbi:hypothetical protein OSB04_028510 [Centaurea solstitialis]|uniref:F-box domain-containing protein n=1 Tax=Centaurea solstitialis TaxID=347529 RepID=A0AA38SHD1_9ASTR|nr:hypothetical protein OSB04_028510 [Centaurea solstitialis]